MRYIHLSGRDLADKLARGMEHIHAWRIRTLTEIGTTVEVSEVSTASPNAITAAADRWSWPILPQSYDSWALIEAAERQAIETLGAVNLRRLRRRDPAAPGWSTLARLLGPLETVNAALDSPLTTHRRRAIDDTG